MATLKRKEKIVKISTQSRIEFYSRLSSQMSRGLSAVDAVERIIRAMSKQSMNNKPVFKAMQYIYASMVSGKHSVSLAQAIKPVVSDGEYTLLSSGEKYGQTIHALNESIYMLESRKKMMKSVIQAVAYPSVILVVILAVLQFFKTSLIPTALKLAPVDKWPSISRSMYWMANDLLPIMAVFIVLLIVGVFALMKIMPRWHDLNAREVWDKFFPPFILFRIINGAMFLISLSSILKTGSSAQEAMEFIFQGSSPYMRGKVRQIQKNMIHGKSIGEAMNVGLFDRETNVSIDIFSNDENFDDRLSDISHEGIENAVASITVIGTGFFYVSLVSVAIVIGVMLLGFMSLSRAVS